ncbi:MAG: terpene cyclase/mutase family protein, partial [bacterium]|nr:terpene cyclase/mutase family protein [bacterium]
LVYGVNPLRISVNDDSPFVSATSTITVEQFGLDESWNPVWMPAASSTLIIGGEEHENDTGIYFFTASSTGQVAVYGKKDDYVNSDQIILTVQAPEAPAEDSAPANNNQSGGSVIIPSSGGGSPTPALPAAKVNLNKAIDFLISKQSAEGSFGSVLITDWAAIALASANPNGASAQKIKSYLLTDPDSAAGLNPVSDYARRAIALMALNISPYDGAKTDYVKKITELFDGQQFGDASLYNDDIFALLALNKSGYGAEDEMIRKTVDFIIAKQRADGSWIGSDLTAAAVQALAPVSALNGVSAALQKARNFLAYAQGADGGYGNTYTTSWVMQAIAVLGEDAGSWQKNNKTPESYLAASQAEDGGLEKGNEYMDNRLWATAYAIPAAQGKGWLNIMNNFSRPNQAEITPDNSAASGHLTATSTLELHQTASSTADVLGIASSSSENLITATGTPAELMEKNVKTETENMVEKKAEPAKAAAAWKKAEEPKVLAVKIARPEPVSFIKKQEPEKADQATTRTQTAPAEDVKSAANLTAADAGQPAAEANIFVLTGRLIYRGFRYVLNLLGF